jgi:glucosamine--fructose-6-phosphate aminotransferase (isomerizing)
MCGIIGYIGKKEAGEILLKGLKHLENRGYDSAGIAGLSSKNGLIVHKFASTKEVNALEELRARMNEYDGSQVGIGHTRWATHGAKTDENAHPHTDASGRFTLVHNGVIENASEIRKGLEIEGIQFQSETDTEVIVQLIGKYRATTDSTAAAIELALNKLQGTWGMAVIDAQDLDVIYLVSHGSPIAVGVSDGEFYIASEPSAFHDYTRQYTILKDGELLELRRSTDLMGRDIHELEGESAPESPHPYPHFTLKEIYEQPEALSRACNYGGRFEGDASAKLGGLEAREEELLKIRRLVIAACGTSAHAGEYAAHAMRRLKSFECVQVVDASELTADHFGTGSGLLVISQSGETKDVHRAVRIAKEQGAPVFSVVNKVNSLIARETGCGVYLNAGYELGVASTKAFTTQVMVLELIALWFAARRGNGESRRRELAHMLKALPFQIGSLLKLDDAMRTLADSLKDAESMFLLGKGSAQAIAKEAALKIKEISYIHAEGYAGGALKHGPFALIEKGTPLLLIAPNDSSLAAMRTAAEEVKARGARVIVMTDAPTEFDDVAEIVEIPTAGPLTSLLAIIPLQFLAYHLSVLRGNNPDRPRNLAKAVTVD